jgi:hypothetical protein
MSTPDDDKKYAEMFAEIIHEDFSPPYGGSSLPTILKSAMLRDVFAKQGFTIVPTRPIREMRDAFRAGWFRSFSQRYASMLEEAWVGWDCSGETDENRHGSSPPPRRRRAKGVR